MGSCGKSSIAVCVEHIHRPSGRVTVRGWTAGCIFNKTVASLKDVLPVSALATWREGELVVVVGVIDTRYSIVTLLSCGI